MIRCGFTVIASVATAGCFWGPDTGNANAEQIEQALTACGVQIKDYARDRKLNGRYLIMYHHNEPDHERKIRCVSEYLAALDVSATGIYPEPANREGLY